MPISFANLFRVAVLVALAAHVFYMYRLAVRVIGEDVQGGGVLAGGFAFVMLLPFVWAVAMPELPEIYTRHIRARWRWNHGRCPGCNYPRHPASTDAQPHCSECAMTWQHAPETYHVTARTIRLFIFLNVTAWFLGCVVALLIGDSARFN